MSVSSTADGQVKLAAVEGSAALDQRITVRSDRAAADSAVITGIAAGANTANRSRCAARARVHALVAETGLVRSAIL